MMKAKSNFVVKFSKLLLVLCTLFSQLSFSLEVFADEIVSSLDDGEAVTILEDSTLENNALSDENTAISEIAEGDGSTDGATSVDGVLDNAFEGDSTEDDDIGSDDTEVLESTSVEIVEEVANVKGTFNSSLIVSMIKASLVEEYPESVISVLFDGNELGDDAVVTNDMVLSIDDMTYTISVYGDYVADGIINEEDVNYIVEDILKVREEGEEASIFSLNDVAYISSSVKNGAWLEEKVVTDELSFSIASSPVDSVLVDDTLEVMLYVNGLENDIINGIEGIVDYDDTLLELQSIKVIDDVYEASDLVNKNEEGKFVYLLEDYKNNEDGLLITLTFKTLMEGEATVTFEGLNLVYDNASFALVQDCDFIGVDVSVTPVGKGGDDDSNITMDAVVSEEEEEKVTYIRPTYVSLSRNNYISSLEIKGYDIEFDRYTYEYSITVGSGVNSLDLTIVLDSSSASYVINGNENFKEGSNVVEIIVAAENGATRTYTINVDKEEVEEEEIVEEKVENNTSKTIVIILIILVIIGLIYVIFKDDEEDEVVKKDNKSNVSSSGKSSDVKKSSVNTKKSGNNTKKTSNGKSKK